MSAKRVAWASLLQDEGGTTTIKDQISTYKIQQLPLVECTQSSDTRIIVACKAYLLQEDYYRLARASLFVDHNFRLLVWQ